MNARFCSVFCFRASKSTSVLTCEQQAPAHTQNYLMFSRGIKILNRVSRLPSVLSLGSTMTTVVQLERSFVCRYFAFRISLFLSFLSVCYFYCIPARIRSLLNLKYSFLRDKFAIHRAIDERWHERISTSLLTVSIFLDKWISHSTD